MLGGGDRGQLESVELFLDLKTTGGYRTRLLVLLPAVAA